ncbi:hypothetical protein EH165_00780 [Nakamurella antarctica]|uniref:Septum formation n=1 Tax=Nakamurella antarctica TaxID=1902245 RepID=A0A3G8ZT07_9ACTN|nr:septum formation family protein [Nakamurella antarctica]AZI56921.1 hypothetical protein EH165_00780 [Nakamurella antarctica]
MTNQRRWGITVLIAALVGLATISVVGHALRPVPGTASAVSPPGPPSVGDCLSTPDFAEGIAFSESTAGPIRVTQVLPLAPCSGPRFGEVFELLPVLTGADRQRAVCSGLDAFAGRSPAVPGQEWSPASAVSVVATGPNDRQFAAGQRWVACVITAALRGQWDGPSRQHFPAIPSAFAACFGRVGPLRFAPLVDCNSPHRMEVLGRMPIIHTGQTQKDLDTTCQRWASKVTLMPEVTAGGLLSVRALVIDPQDSQEVIDPASLAEGEKTFAMCIGFPSAEDRMLVGPLASLGSAPVPIG